MNDQMDCALLVLDNNPQWALGYSGSYAQGRLSLQVLNSAHLALPTIASSEQTLRAMAMHLMRFDACILLITHDNLVWARKSLMFAQSILQTPIFALVCNVKAAALNDLLKLGIVDFLRTPICIEELRIRIQMLKRNRHAAMALEEAVGGQYQALNPAFVGAGQSPEEDRLCATILHQNGATLEAYAAAVATRYATSRESFQQAKAVVVARFEQAYIRAALGRSSGNIAMAARSVQKHRRAFWALMRKHDIKADVFKSASALDTHTDG
ncbi:hypothetical protein L1889_13225 [Paenalcaligenes niemegkensis]|uniref:hypothetical protein n=1 Tax=Paenalcaligenes niemegkensis TaxID=2895469 RepID=UPI001EE8328A|nr:hypothetical protein [Paenalcaligenes niemegkensis]MCQ9617524.1 hypothetical protein [Paenalcaligenes niemegkensis]